MKRRVAITGLGAVTPVGLDVKAFWQALRDGVSGIDTITRFDPTPFRSRVAAEVRGFDPHAFISEEAATMSRFVQLGVAAARMAYDDAGLAGVSGAQRVPVCFGSAAGAVPEFQHGLEQFLRRGMRRRYASVVVESVGHAVTNRIAVELELTGQTMTLGSACASGIDTIQWACEQIRAGRSTAVLAGATDASLATSVHGAWGKLGWLSRWPGPPAQSLRPFEAFSTGSVLGEGAAAFVLEDLDHARARGARLYAEILGYGSTNDGLDLRTVDPTGASLQAAVRQALKEAGLDPTEIDCVNTHGGGIPKHDRAETAAYRGVFGRHAYNFPVSSIKPMVGQPFAAAGAMQVVAGCFSLTEQFAPPTLNHDIPDVDCDLDYVPNRGRPVRVNRLLVTTRAIGPTHSAVILGLPPDR